MRNFRVFLTALWAKAMGKVNGYLHSERFRGDAEWALRQAGNWLTRSIPGSIDDALWAALQTKFPNLLTGTAGTTPDEMKLAALAIATEILKHLQPGLSTTEARAAVQVAYADSVGN